MFGPIIVPLDGSRLAEWALGPARALAQSCQSELVLIRVVNPTPELFLLEPSIGVVYPDPTANEVQREAAAYLETLRSTYARDDLAVHTMVRADEALVGDVPAAIVDAAGQVRAGLIVMSSHGYSGLKRWALGSVAERVLAAAPCPVLVVRAPLAAGHMVIALDGSHMAESVLTPAIAVARCFGTKITLLRSVPELSGADVSQLDTLENGLGRRMVDEAREAAADYLAGIADRIDDGSVSVTTAVRWGPAAETILEYAERHDVDLVAMTTHGRTGLRRWIYGSVTQKVLSHLPVSMLIARSPAAALN